MKLKLRILVLGLSALITTKVSAQGLVRYSVLLDRNDVQLWEVDTSRSFDAEGIILNKGDYHPVGIVQYGMLCLDHFNLTGDSSYLKKSMNQAEYILSDKYTHQLHDGAAIGLPYNFEYKGLSPPWYSGMAQGLAVSFLLRYAKVVDDPRLEKRIHKMVELMLRPAGAPGCLSRTPEGLVWLEEYPNTPQSPQVLNGFIFSLVGLIEYVNSGLSNRRVERLTGDLIQSLKALIHVYDRLSWTNYNRAVVYPNRLNYVQLQIFQMRQLHELTGDDFWTRQLCIWSAMAFGKKHENVPSYWAFHDHEIGIPSTINDQTIKPDPYSSTYTDFEKRRLSLGLVDSMPWYSFAASEILVVKNERTFNITLDSSAKDVHILYRYHWDGNLFQTEKWKAANGISATGHSFTLAPGLCQFGVFYGTERPDSELKILNIGWVE